MATTNAAIITNGTKPNEKRTGLFVKTLNSGGMSMATQKPTTKPVISTFVAVSDPLRRKRIKMGRPAGTKTM